MYAVVYSHSYGARQLLLVWWKTELAQRPGPEFEGLWVEVVDWKGITWIVQYEIIEHPTADNSAKQNVSGNSGILWCFKLLSSWPPTREDVRS